MQLVVTLSFAENDLKAIEIAQIVRAFERNSPGKIICNGVRAVTVTLLQKLNSFYFLCLLSFISQLIFPFGLKYSQNSSIQT